MATESQPATTVRAHSALERWLLNEIEKAHGVKPLSADCTFGDLGMKPLDFIELVMTAEERHRIEIPDDIALACETPADLASRIEARIGERRRA